MKFNRYPIIYCLLFTVYCFFCCCNSTKKLANGELLLHKNSITGKYGKINKSDMDAYIKQKPNRRILFWRFYLHTYTSVNQEKLKKKKEKRSVRIESINSRRIEKNNRINENRKAEDKEPKKVTLKKENILTRREWLLRIGEPPVIYDYLLSEKSVRQINLFLSNKGFFNSIVKDSLSIKHKKATVHYIVHAGKPYTIRNINYKIKDAQLNYYVLADTSASLIKGASSKNRFRERSDTILQRKLKLLGFICNDNKVFRDTLKRGTQYDVELLQKERDRITNMLRNDGYFLFSKEYIYFDVDSSLGTQEVDITLGIKNPILKTVDEKDTTIEINHKRFYINNIYVYTDYDPTLKTSPMDTLVSNDYYLLSSGHLRYKPHLITDAVFISKGGLFQQQHSDQTFKRLSALKMFRTVQLQFTDVGNAKIDCHIYLSNIPKQSFSVETEGTNTSGTLGIAGSLIYQNKNTFKGGEIFEVKLKGALEIQKTKIKQENSGVENIFNTREVGVETNFQVPRFLTPFPELGTKSNNAKTNFTSSYNYQFRPDFGRSIANLSYGYSWKETVTKQHLINPMEFNLVNIDITDTNLRNTIDHSKDLFLKNSYSNHFTLGSRYAFIFSNQDIRKRKSFSYLRFGAEGAGNAMRGIFELIDSSAMIKHQLLDYYLDSTKNKVGTYDKEKNYTIENIRFAQYIRFDFDYRYYKLLNDKDKLVFRFACGVGKPLHNLRVLPLEKSFFCGGPNSVRAWQARTLGPGGYSDAANTNFADKIGDNKIEANIEYRFNVYKLLNAALFVDAGNIWLRKTYSNYPNGKFSFLGDSTVGSFIYQIAIGAGVGIRLDFNFFIIRLDGAFKVRDPALPADDRWTFDKQPIKYAVLNFGIGYPF